MQLPGVGRAGQERLARARVLVVGCGALGTAACEQLARGGVGSITIVDRDLVEHSNLQRQTLFTEQDARRAVPKAEAAKARLGAINSEVRIRAFVDDLHAGNASRYASECDCIIDCLDNFESRFALNDCAVQRGLPLIYGGAVGWTGMAAALLPHVGVEQSFGGVLQWSPERATPCLRCLIPDPPDAGETATCDSAGIFGPVAAMVGAIEAALAMRLFTEGPAHMASELIRVDLSTMAFGVSALAGSRDPGCRCCGAREFCHPRAEEAGSEAGCRVLCGRNAVELRLSAGVRDLDRIEGRLRSAGQVASGVHGSTHVLRVTLAATGCGDAPSALSILAGETGVRAIVDGTRDAEKARAVVARWVGV